MIKNSKHFIAFTGAGLSTSAGIPDFRSGVSTILPTGPGAWEKLATGVRPKPKLQVAIEQAIPTPSHMALIALEKAGYLKFLISQNVDGLHRKSGFPVDKLAELHGNDNLEICKNPDCKKQYMRDFSTRTAEGVHEHDTGRKCENCGGMLYDTIINFGESLPEAEIQNGFEHSKQADLCLVLGSSLRVTPAANMPKETYKNKGKLVIVNLQATPLDAAALRINGMIDVVIAKLMAKLNLEIPQFVLKRRLGVRLVMENDKKKLIFRGLDSDNSTYTLFTKLKVEIVETGEKFFMKKEPFHVLSKTGGLDSGQLKVKMHFQKHFGEPNLEIKVPISGLSEKEKIYLLEFDPSEGTWVHCYDLDNTKGQESQTGVTEIKLMNSIGTSSTSTEPSKKKANNCIIF